MGSTLEFPTPPGGGDDHVISQSPYRLRWADWRIANIILVHVQSAAVYEDQRQEDLAQGREPGGQVPPHFVLDGGMQQTAMAILRHHRDPQALRDISYLAALMEALVNTPCAILRTDLIRRVYQEVDALSSRLSLRWQGQAEQFLLPLNEDAQHPGLFAQRVPPLDNLQEFFQVLGEIADQRHQALGKSYVFYYPRHRGL